METEYKGEIMVHVLEPHARMQDHDNIKIIRIKSRDFNLYVMKDYWPIVGEINGSCYLEGDETISYENINAFYSMSHNVFNLIIKEYAKMAIKDKYEEYNLTGKRILVVDDSNLNLKLAQRLISKYGAELTLAHSGKECLEILEKDPSFDMLLLDDMMPEMSGIDTIKKIKEGILYRNPIIALTANELAGMEQKYKTLGFDDYVPKPIHVEKIEEIFGKYLLKLAEKSSLPEIKLDKNNKIEIVDVSKETGV